MKDFFTQIGIGIVMAILFVATIVSIVVVWAGILLYSAFQWAVTNDGYTHNKCKCGCSSKNHTELYKPLDPKLEQEFNAAFSKKPLDPKLEQEFNAAFSKKPFPKPYSPTDNPLYRPTPEELAKLKAKLPPFDREKVFKMVDESNVRMSKMTQKERHNLRGEKGRFHQTKSGTNAYHTLRSADQRTFWESMRRNLAIGIENGTELERVLTILFSVGFVFNNDKRIKTFVEFCKVYPEHKYNSWAGWSWIALGKDRECKMVLDAYTVQPLDSSRITVEEVIELVKQNNW